MSWMSSTFAWFVRGKAAEGKFSFSGSGRILALTIMVGPGTPFDMRGFGKGSSESTREWYLEMFSR